MDKTGRYISQSEAARRLGVDRSAICKLQREDNTPTWLVPYGGRIMVDTMDPTWQQREEVASARDIAEDEPEQDSTEPGYLDDMDIPALKKELQRLKAGSIKAGLEIPIQKAELNRFKIEQERIALKRAAGQLIEYSLCEYLFIGYLERLNRELLDASKKTTKEIEMKIQDAMQTKAIPGDVAKQIAKIITRETEAAIRAVVSEQKKDVEEWRDDLQTGKN